MFFVVPQPAVTADPMASLESIAQLGVFGVMSVYGYITKRDLTRIGTFAVMAALGFSLNNLSLMALTIATGFVVDDAIVMMENIARYREQGFSAMEATIPSANEALTRCR